MNCFRCGHGPVTITDTRGGRPELCSACINYISKVFIPNPILSVRKEANDGWTNSRTHIGTQVDRRSHV